jgi:LysR family transcriptional regulator, hydrogen peroxide-inducible genes activator
MKNINLGFSLRDLSYLVAVAEELSFRKAAERCCVSQSTLSIQVKKCEAYLGVEVFERAQHYVSVTPVGADIIALARVAVDAAQFIKEIASRTHTEQSKFNSVPAVPSSRP